MNILIIGSGGREHALAWKAVQSPLVDRVFVAPGNGGTALEPGVENLDVDPADQTELARFARDNAVELTIVGPEAPLVAGIADTFADAGLACFGPSADAARLEGSKAFAKDFMRRHGIPTPSYQVFDGRAAAVAHVRAKGGPCVVKADGLAGGKGVIVASAPAEAEAAIDAILAGGRFGAAGRRVVIEDRVRGE
jgi:phosphoribosylamine--glycine ligase